jgi:hypothetical protein
MQQNEQGSEPTGITARATAMIQPATQPNNDATSDAAKRNDATNKTTP